MTAAVAEKRLSKKQKKRLEDMLEGEDSLATQLLIENVLGQAPKPKLQVRLPMPLLYQLYREYEKEAKGRTFPDYIRDLLAEEIFMSPPQMDAAWYQAIAELHYETSD